MQIIQQDWIVFLERSQEFLAEDALQLVGLQAVSTRAANGDMLRSEHLPFLPTFMANPLACAAANASLDLFATEPRLEQVKVIERSLLQAFEPCQNLPGVVDVRVKGAVGVIQVDKLHHLDQLRARFVAAGVWLRPFADMIYVTPSFTITTSELAELCDAVVAVTTEWSRW